MNESDSSKHREENMRSEGDVQSRSNATPQWASTLSHQQHGSVDSEGFELFLTRSQKRNLWKKNRRETQRRITVPYGLRSRVRNSVN